MPLPVGEEGWLPLSPCCRAHLPLALDAIRALPPCLLFLRSVCAWLRVLFLSQGSDVFCEMEGCLPA